MVWGRQDPHISEEGRALIYQAMNAAGTVITWHEFNGQHAFLREERPQHDPELARISQGLILDLFRRKLGEGDLPA